MVMGGAGAGESEDGGLSLDLLHVVCLLDTHVEMSSKNRRHSSRCRGSIQAAGANLGPLTVQGH